MAVTPGYMNGIAGVRADESAVRLVFVEHSADYAALVRETLEKTQKGHFEVRHASRMDAAVSDVEHGQCDAVLVDLTTGTQSGTVTFEDASVIANQVPVIVLTGDDDENEDVNGADPEADFRDRIAHSRLPDAILSAVRRSRRLGQQGAADPIVLRDPLRAFASAFARLRRTFSR